MMGIRILTKLESGAGLNLAVALTVTQALEEGWKQGVAHA